MTSRLHLLVALAALLSIPRVTHADEPAPSGDEGDVPDDVDEAGSLFREAAALAEQNRWRDALVLFERAASLRPHASTTYNMGYCERGIGHNTRARMHFLQALRQDGDSGETQLSAAQRSAARTYLAQAEEQLARARVELSPSDARVAVGGRPLEVERVDDSGALLVAGTRTRGEGETPPTANFELLIDAGTHELVLSAADGRSVTITQSFEPGGTEHIRLVLPPAAPKPPPVPTASRAAQPDGTGQLIGAGVLGGFSVVAAVAGTIFAIDAANTHSDAEEACPQLTFCLTDEGSDLSLEARRSGNFATVGFVVAGAAAAGAFVLWLTAPPVDSMEPEISLRLGPGQLSIGAKL